MDIEHASDLIMAAGDISRMKGVLTEIRDSLGLANVVYHRVRSSRNAEPDEKPLLILTYEDEWVQRYTSRDYFKIDPLVRIGSSAVSPIDWGRVDRSTFSVRQMFAEADRHNVGRQGISIPVRGPGGERAIFSVTSNKTDREWTELKGRHIGDLLTLGQQVHDRVAYMTGIRIDDGPRLNARETECMGLIVKGKSVKQIADTMTITEGAVRLLLRSVRHKLSSATLHQAVARAVQYGIVTP